jgi:hypothetical protein
MGTTLVDLPTPSPPHGERAVHLQNYKKLNSALPDGYNNTYCAKKELPLSRHQVHHSIPVGINLTLTVMEAPQPMTTRKTYSHHLQHIARDESVSTPRHYIPTTMAVPHSSQYLTPAGSPLPTNYTLDGAYPQHSSQCHAQNGYLDSFAGLDFLGMAMDPNTHAGAEFDLLSVHEQPRAPQMLERPRRTRRETYDVTKAPAAQKDTSPPGRRRQRRARSADSSVEGETPSSNASGRPTSPKKQKRGRPRLDTKDENAADVS